MLPKRKGRRNNDNQGGLLDYLFVDHTRLKDYLHQMGKYSEIKKVLSWEIGVSTTGPSIKLGQNPQVSEFNVHKAILTLIKYLRKNKLLSEIRPEYEYDDMVGQDFVLEDMYARKIIFPVPPNSRVANLSEIVVWWSPPIETHAEEEVPKSAYHCKGTFLYLLESHWKPDEKYSGVFSSLTALSMMISELEEALILPTGSKEKLGWAKENKLHPLDHIRRFNAHIQEPRKIRSLYRKRYISNDQFYDTEKGRRRSFDLFAYPIFIAAI